jgi:hypothetical protein
VTELLCAALAAVPLTVLWTFCRRVWTQLHANGTRG